MAFQGYLVKVGTGSSAVEIPTRFIEGKSYKVTPDQRMEWSAERDVTGVLKRETVANMPPKIEFNTIPHLSNADVSELNGIIQAKYTNEAERKLPITFYDPESDSYKTWDCYMPDVQYPISQIDAANRIIYYESLRYAFIGY